MAEFLSNIGWLAAVVIPILLPEWLQGLGIEWRVVERDTYSVVKRLTPDGKTFCPVCSRLRRGILWRCGGDRCNAYCARSPPG